MQNFIFISPNFPTNYWRFCRELKQNGLRVLGIGDQPYDQLSPELWGSLDEYYKVSSLENYDEVYRAVAFFIHRYGRIDWLESNNEYWLERDAMLRTDFHITSGWQVEDLARIKYKSGMKEYYQRAGIPTARWHIVDDEAGCLAFISEVGWPVIVKPDDGVGASDTHKLANEDDLRRFLKRAIIRIGDAEHEGTVLMDGDVRPPFVKQIFAVRPASVVHAVLDLLPANTFFIRHRNLDFRPIAVCPAARRDQDNTIRVSGQDRHFRFCRFAHGFRHTWANARQHGSDQEQKNHPSSALMHCHHQWNPPFLPASHPIP